MPGRVCWFCDRYSNMTYEAGRGTEVRKENALDAMGVYRCNGCDHLSLAIVRFDGYSERPTDGIESALERSESAIVWIPEKGIGKSFPDVPASIASTASEVHRCLSINAHRAAIALARAVVEATAKERGITKGRLLSKIDELHALGLIREHTREAAHEVRLGGNEVAHGDLAETAPDADEAHETVALMDEVLLEVYQSPARIARVRELRASRAVPATSPPSA